MASSKSQSAAEEKEILSEALGNLIIREESEIPLLESSSHNPDLNYLAGSTVASSATTRMNGKASDFAKATINSATYLPGSVETAIANNLTRLQLHHNKESRHSKAIKEVQQRQGDLKLEYFRMLKRIGNGGTGIVYVAELLDTNTFFAVKVKEINSETAARINMERIVLKMLDHPLLPTLFFYCEHQGRAFFVTEYCPGDLNMLRGLVPGNCFPQEIARFYVAEILLALEYLHMLGIVYRDLKPENVLLKEDGHIMLTDFDLSQIFEVEPMVIDGSSKNNHQITCIKSSYFSFLSGGCSKNRAEEIKEQVQFLAESHDGHSDSFVGTQEYLAPEMVQKKGHGHAVDWWTLGIFMYELIYGVTPFEGRNSDETMENIVERKLKFLADGNVSDVAKDLMKKLLARKPTKRLGHYYGASQIKKHPFFQGIQWSLLLSRPPRMLPTPPMSIPSLAVIEEEDESDP